MTSKSNVDNDQFRRVFGGTEADDGEGVRISFSNEEYSKLRTVLTFALLSAREEDDEAILDEIHELLELIDT